MNAKIRLFPVATLVVAAVLGGILAMPACLDAKSRTMGGPFLLQFSI